EPPKNYSTKPVCPNCNSKTTFIRAISFVDAPGHEALMATMLSGAAIMDGAILVIAADEPCPQPQTREHLAAAEIIGIKKIVIVQNKIDIVDEKRARESYSEIKNFVKGTIAENAPIIPVSSEKKINIDSLLEAIQNYIPTPQRDLTKPPKMFIVRSFDINKPGTEIEDLKGGVLGGSLIQGELRIGDEIEIKPGIKIKENWVPLKTKVIGLQKAGKNLEVAGAGGLLGVMTELDNFLTKADSLTGSVAGKNLPPVLNKLKLKFSIFKFEEKINPLKIEENVMVSVGSARTLGIIKSIKKDLCEIELKMPVCAEKGERVVLARRINEKWKLVGSGLIE
ncbi:MAG: translation initiation factor IF-2 subunit gamma, partial [Candidatus Aenigmatarchaeota archaeon]